MFVSSNFLIYFWTFGVSLCVKAELLVLLAILTKSLKVQAVLANTDSICMRFLDDTKKGPNRPKVCQKRKILI